MLTMNDQQYFVIKMKLNYISKISNGHYLYPRFEEVRRLYWFTSVRPVRPLLMKFIVKDFSTTMQAKMIIFGMQVDDDLLYPGIENQPSSLIRPCFCPIFFHFILRIIKFSSEISSQPCKLEWSYLVCRL